MTNLFGPGAFDCARPAPVRPAFSPDNGPGDPDDWFKDCSSPLARDGTEWRATLLNFLIANLRSFVRKSGVSQSNIDDDLLIKALFSHGANRAVAGGTANDIVITLPLVPPDLAALENVPLWIKTGGAANSGAVTLNPNGLGATQLRGADNLPLPAGVLPADTVFQAVYNGAWFQLLSIVPPSAAKVPAAFIMTPAAVQAIAASTTTVITHFSPVSNDTLDSTLATNQVTIGTKDAGWWAITGKLFYDAPASGTMYTNIIIERNGSEIAAGNAPGTTSIRARPSAAAIYKLAGGDVIRLTTATDTARSLVITGGSSIFAGFKIGA